MTEAKVTEIALKKFEEAAIKHTEATEQGDYKTANKNYKVITKAIASLKSLDEVKSLHKFLSHNSDGVKVWAATYLLPVEEHKAIGTLKEIANKKGLSSLDAETTLSEWKKGNLQL